MRVTVRKMGWVFLFLLGGIRGFEQPTNLSFDHLTIENGLPENFPRAIVQDKLGYIWISTQNGLVQYDGYHMKIYKPAEALSGSSGFNIVNYLFKDHEGTIWMASRLEGLWRFDRSLDRFRQFKYAPGTCDWGRILTIKEDRKGNFWILSFEFNDSSYNIDRFNPVTGTYVNFNTNPRNRQAIAVKTIFNLQIDSGGKPWIGTDNGLYEFNEQQQKFIGFFTSPLVAEQKSFTVLYQSPTDSGSLWMAVKKTEDGSALGLFHMEGPSHTLSSCLRHGAGSGGLLNDTVYSITEDKKGNLWIGTARGLSRYDRPSGHFVNYIPPDQPGASDANAIMQIKEDKPGNLWMAASFGLLFFDPRTARFTRYTQDKINPDGLPSDYIWNIFIDQANDIWLTLDGFGVQKLRPDRFRFTFYRQDTKKISTGYPGGWATRFVPESDGTWWMATEKGLYHWNPQTDVFKRIPSLDSRFQANYVQSALIKDKEGIIWYCYTDNNLGLFRYNPSTGEIKNYQNKPSEPTSLSDNNIETLFEDRSGTLWIGTEGSGLCSLNKQTGVFTRYPFIGNDEGSKKPDNGQLDDNRVFSITEDQSGNLWIGTNMGGLNKLNRKTGRFTSYLNSHKGLYCIDGIEEDGAGHLWLSSYLFGLSLFDPQSGNTTRFTEKDGLLCDIIDGMTKDRNGNLWITSERGLSEFNVHTHGFKNYTREQGLPDNKLTDGVACNAEGQVLVGSAEGFISFSLQGIGSNTTTPYINIESLTYSNPNAANEQQFQTAGQEKKELPYDEHRISFHYVGLQYNNPAMNQYQYKLEGYDHNWIQAGPLRVATYTNLSPGTYRFLVKAANSDGVWNENAASFQVVIGSPWWKTWWAYLLMILLLGVLVSAIIFIRSMKLIKEKRVLEHKVNVRTNELRASLDHLKETQLQLVQREKMASLGELTAGIAHEIQNPLNFVNNFSEVNKELLVEMNEAIRKGEYEQATAIARDISTNEDKVNHHGRRADAIVKGMLQHSRNPSGRPEPTDLNALADEYLRLAYRGARSKDASLQAILQTDYDPSLEPQPVIAQEMARVLLNVYNNAFDAVIEKKKSAPASYEPLVSVSTKKGPSQVEIRIADNGCGIAENLRDKIFQPFFTTKPAGQGTGLGLSLSYDIIKMHRGQIEVQGRPGGGTELIIRLPLNPGTRKP